MINLSICLSDIPKEKMKRAENGKIYVNLTVIPLKEDTVKADEYGNTHAVSVSRTREERDAQAPAIWVGRGKEYIFTPSAPQSAEAVDALPPISPDEDLPF